MAEDHGVPVKVWNMMIRLGMHNDCLVSENLCPACEANWKLAFDHHYADATSLEDLIDRIFADLAKDREDRLMGLA